MKHIVLTTGYGLGNCYAISKFQIFLIKQQLQVELD